MSASLKKINIYKCIAALSFYIVTINPLYAAISVTQISNASVINYDSGTTPYAYASFAEDCSSVSNTASNPDSPCSNSPIDKSSNLTITFTHASGEDADYIAVDNLTDANVIDSTGSKGVSNGGSGTIYIEWSELCTLEESTNATCTSPVSDSIYIVADKNENGEYDSGEESLQIKIKISPGNQYSSVSSSDCSGGSNGGTESCVYALSLDPGDAKAYISSIGYSSVYPGDGSYTLDTAYLRVYFSTTSNDIAPSSSNYADIAIDDDDTTDYLPDNSAVEGLENEVLHYFRIAIVDEATTVHNWLDASVSITATPSKVMGLIEESQCFIATAAYGSLLNPKLIDFRNFRDNVLSKNFIGRKFIQLYYNYSPKLATKIAQSKSLQWTTRVMLWPVWLFTKIYLEFGIETFILSIMAIIGLIYFGVNYYDSRRV